MDSRPLLTRTSVSVLAALTLAAILLIAGTLLLKAPAAAPPELGNDAAAVESGSSIHADIPVAPDYTFNEVGKAQPPTLEPAAVVALARELGPPGFVGKSPVVRYLAVKSGRLDYGATYVVLSTDAAAIRPIGDGVACDPTLRPIAATYSWVFLSPDGEFMGATRQGYPADPPPVPAE